MRRWVVIRAYWGRSYRRENYPGADVFSHAMIFVNDRGCFVAFDVLRLIKGDFCPYTKNPRTRF